MRIIVNQNPNVERKEKKQKKKTTNNQTTNQTLTNEQRGNSKKAHIEHQVCIVCIDARRKQQQASCCLSRERIHKLGGELVCLEIRR